MKTITQLITATIIIGFFSACKKDSSITPSANLFHKPNVILMNWEYNGSTWVRNGYMLLDIDHADNKDKSFMVVDIKGVPGGFKMELKKGPLPIDSLATNWPAQVRSVSYGYTSDMAVNAAMKMRVDGFDGKRFVYRYDSTHLFANSIFTYNHLNNPLYAGAMAGKTPQGKITAFVNDGSGNARMIEVICYFKEGFCTNVSTPTSKAYPFTELVNGVPTLTGNMARIDAAITIEGIVYSQLYFDFDSWEFFITEDFCPATIGAKCPGGVVQYVDYQSMNKLMEWPAGWGKK